MKLNKKIICFIVIAFIIFVAECLLLKEMAFGRREHIEDDNVEIITNRFKSFSNISRCFYKIDVLSGGIGPTAYNMYALVIVDEEESKYLLNQYEWKIDQIPAVDEDLYQGVGIEPVEEWLHSDIFESDTLGSYIGEVFFSAEKNCIYINAGP